MNVLDYTIIPKKTGIYKIVNKINNKFYIGSAVNLYLRIQRHNYELKKEKHVNIHLQRALKKYGNNCFYVEIIKVFESIDYEDLLKKEKDLIIKEKAITKGYNQIIDNSSFLKDLNKSKKHIESNKKRNSLEVYGFDRFTGSLIYEFPSLSEAARKIKDQSTNISSCCKGKLNYVKDIVWIYKKDYDVKKDYSFKEHALKNKIFSNDHKEKLRNGVAKFKGKKVYKYDDNLELIDSYVSISEAERENNLNKESLRYKLNKELHLGYYWKTNKL